MRLDTPLKTVGVYDVKLTLHPEVSLFIKVSIAPSEEEAKKLLESPDGVFKKETTAAPVETIETEHPGFPEENVADLGEELSAN